MAFVCQEIKGLLTYLLTLAIPDQCAALTALFSKPISKAHFCNLYSPSITR